MHFTCYMFPSTGLLQYLSAMMSSIPHLNEAPPSFISPLFIGSNSTSPAVKTCYVFFYFLFGNVFSNNIRVYTSIIR